MKVSKTEIKYLGQLLLAFTLLNVSLNLIGLFISNLLDHTKGSSIENIKVELIIPLIIQSLIFGICVMAGRMFLKNKKFTDYVFVAFQFVLFHIIFFLNLKIHHGIHFESTFNNIGLRYLSNSGQYLVDILYVYIPINGMFENGLFQPDHLGTFYFHWILLNLVYYIALTWLSIRVLKFFFRNAPKVQPGQQEEVTGNMS